MRVGGRCAEWHRRVGLGIVAALAGVSVATGCQVSGGEAAIERELGVCANCECPGGPDAPLLRETRPAKVADPDSFVTKFGPAHPLGRSGCPADVASADSILASDSAVWTSVASLIVDGCVSTG